MKNRILELLNNQRRGLFEEEIMNHQRGPWERFRSGWRRHKGLRMLGAVALAGAVILNPTIAGYGMLLGAKAIYSGLSTEVAVESGWETVRNSRGKTKGHSRKEIKNMDAVTLQDTLAAQTTLAISEKSDVNRANLNVNVRNRLPVTDEEFNKAENPAVNEIYSGSSTSRELWNQYNAQMRGVIDEGINAGENIDQIMDRVFAKEKDLMVAIENRENEIRKNNMYKKITAISAAVLTGGLIYGLGHFFGPNPGPKPPVPVPPGTPVPPVPVPPTPSGVGFTIPERVFPPNVGNADLIANPGLVSDETPGIFQSIAEKLGSSAHGTRMFDHDPQIIQNILHDNPALNGNINAIVYSGDKIKISDVTAKLIGDKTGLSAAEVLKKLKSQWVPKNL